MTEASAEFFSSVLWALWWYSGCLINADFGNADFPSFDEFSVSMDISNQRKLT